jgi:hypothetical protein
MLACGRGGSGLKPKGIPNGFYDSPAFRVTDFFKEFHSITHFTKEELTVISEKNTEGRAGNVIVKMNRLMHNIATKYIGNSNEKDPLNTHYNYKKHMLICVCVGKDVSGEIFKSLVESEGGYFTKARVVMGFDS